MSDTVLSNEKNPVTDLWNKVSNWILSTDHKKIGIMYIFTAFFFFIIGGTLAGMIRTQLLEANSQFMDGTMFNGVVSMHGTIMVFLWVMPVMVGFINLVLPLQIGAKDMAFPRLNALSFWLFVAGGIVLLSTFFLGMPRAGWTGYVPLSLTKADLGMDIWIVALEILGVSSLLGAINFLVTIAKRRTTGMNLFRLPLFVWSTMVTGWLIVLAFPALTIGLLAVLLERHFPVTFFNSLVGGDPLLYQHLFWFFGHPEVYILIMPAFGIVSEVIPAFSRKHIFGYHAMVWSLISIAFLSMLVWAHHMFTSGMDPVATVPFMILTMVVGVPTGIKMFNWLGTLFRGRITFTPQMLFALGFIFTFTVGGVTGVMLAVVPFDRQVTDTYFIVGHMHMVLFGGSVMAIYAATYHWWPKITGKIMKGPLAQLHFWLTLFGSLLSFMPMHWLGYFGMPRRIVTYASNPEYTTDNIAASIGGAIMGVAFLFLLINMVWTQIKGKKVGNNPWNLKGLEWTIASPAPDHSFDTPPVVTEGPYNYGSDEEEHHV